MSTLSTPRLLFLYNTRTILRRPASWAPPASSKSRCYASDNTRNPRGGSSKRKSLNDNAIPFDWGEEGPPPQIQSFGSETSDASSTITPGEAGIFERIFEEISQGRALPSQAKGDAVRKKTHMTPASFDKAERKKLGGSKSVADKARMSEFREKVLTRYPESLRSAAQSALGSFEANDNDAYSELSQEGFERRTENDRKRTVERKRVEHLMDSCKTDIELWRVMEQEVFQLPTRLGLVQGAGGTEGPKIENTADQNIMELHGPLFPHFLIYGLRLFESRFDRTSPFTFHILPRVKGLGLPAYVLGVSTTFYSALAEVHWTRFGDANGALDAVQEMINVGLAADEDVYELLSRMRDHINGGAWGAQGPFVKAVMETSAYNGEAMQRLEMMLSHARTTVDGEAEGLNEEFEEAEDEEPHGLESAAYAR